MRKLPLKKFYNSETESEGYAGEVKEGIDAVKMNLMEESEDLISDESHLASSSEDEFVGKRAPVNNSISKEESFHEEDDILGSSSDGSGSDQPSEDEDEQPFARFRHKQPARTSNRARTTRTYNEDALQEDINEAIEFAQQETSSSDYDSEAENKRPVRKAAMRARKRVTSQVSKKPFKKQMYYIESSDEYDDESGLEAEEEVDDPQSEIRVESILAGRVNEVSKAEEYLVKYKGCSYRKTEWLNKDILIAERAQLLRNYIKRQRDSADCVDDSDLVDGIHPDYVDIDRIIAKRVQNGEVQYFVKWRGLGYGESTWESQDELLMKEEDIEHMERFHTFNKNHHQCADGSSVHAELKVNLEAVPTFLNNKELRDYQKVSLHWMIGHRYASPNPVHCILGDEMGLGKTAQSIAVLAYQRQFGDSRGPFLVLAPLTTLGHWQREIEAWTDMNCVVYAGSAVDRSVIQKHDLWLVDESNKKVVKPHVVLTPYEILLKDKSLFQSIVWETVIIDEAHRMKSIHGATRAAVAEMTMEWLLLLTGTPVQNNMRELYGLLNLVNPTKFKSEQDFLDAFGDERKGMHPNQVKALQEVLKPILLRRMKEDVETLPEKEEVIIWVELTAEQRAYYKAIYERQIGTLMAGSAPKNLPNMRNLAMELRKVCNHPFLCNGLEEDISQRSTAAGMSKTEGDLIVHSSGKMVLLSKLLPKLKSEGRKVLIFSQFKIMLDVLEDWLRMQNWPCERIDGSTSSRDRQAAIDRYSKPGSDGFVFLLSTRAGGQGITLTAADTAIIYDSDFNPQNDLQAMARCHRIGQDKEVTVYRLLSKGTYEESVFQISTRKCGLEEAILGGIGSSGGSTDPEADSKKIAELLKHGAHCITMEEHHDAKTDAFASEGIEQILTGRTEKRQIGNRAGNTFSVATFGSAVPSSDNNDKSAFWESLLPAAAAAHQAASALPKEIILAPRKRKTIDYSEKLNGKSKGRNKSSGEDIEDSDFKINESDDDEDKKSTKTVSRPRAGWSHIHLSAVLENGILQYGGGRVADWLPKVAELKTKSIEEVTLVEQCLIALICHAAEVLKRPTKTATKRQLGGSDNKVIITKCGVCKSCLNPQSKQACLQKKCLEIELAHADSVKSAVSATGEAVSLVSTAVEVPWTDIVPAGLPLPPGLDLERLQGLEAKLRTRCHEMQETIQQLTALHAWVQSGGVEAPKAPLKGVNLPIWWAPHDDAALLRGLHKCGFNPCGRRQCHSIAAVLSEESFGFSKKLHCRTPVAASDDDGRMMTLDDILYPPLNEKAWNSTLQNICKYIKVLLNALLDPQAALEACFTEARYRFRLAARKSQWERDSIKVFRRTHSGNVDVSDLAMEDVEVKEDVESDGDEKCRDGCESLNKDVTLKRAPGLASLSTSGRLSTPKEGMPALSVFDETQGQFSMGLKQQLPLEPAGDAGAKRKVTNLKQATLFDCRKVQRTQAIDHEEGDQPELIEVSSSIV